MASIRLALTVLGLLAASAVLAAPVVLAAPAPPPRPASLALPDRIGWGGGLPVANPARYLREQLNPPAADGLPPEIQAQIDAMDISTMTLAAINTEIRGLQKTAQAAQGTPEYNVAQKAYQGRLNDLARQTQTRSLLRDIYSGNQLKEQLTWFWMNHFSVHQGKGLIRAFVGDYEETIRAHALGKFKDLLFATMTHPAMLQYLDNQQNAKGRINENYAREIMELHTLGVGSGYTQQDVQELARVLTGLGVNLSGEVPNIPAAWRDRYRASGLFEFNPMRHDFGEKKFLGGTIGGEGLDEAARAAVYLSLEPPTAHFISRKLAEYFCCDAPPEKLVTAMAVKFRASDGDITAVLTTLFNAPEFTAALGKKFKDPMHYAVSAVRAAYGDTPIQNVAPVINWLQRMGQPLYGHETPDGYALTADAWNGPGAMETRFEIAGIAGAGRPSLLLPEPPPPGRGMIQTAAPLVRAPPPPDLPNASYVQALMASLAPTTRDALAKAKNPADWNMLFLASPEFMYR